MTARSAGLDLIRIGAAFAVFAYHVQYVSGFQIGGPLSLHGNLAVPAFFALSGYLVYGPFTRREVRPFRYLLRRASRIVPAAVVALVAIGLAMPHESFKWLVVVFWSLLIEAEFYIALPLVARLAAGRELRVVASLAAASWIAAAVAHPEPTTVNALAIGPLFFWCFAGGMALAVVERDRRALLERLPLLALGGCLVVLALLVPGAVVTDPLPVLATAALMGGLVVARVRQSDRAELAAEASYSFYLWHAPSIALIAPFAGGAMLGVSAFAVAATASTASVLLVERPVRGRWLGRGRSAQEPVMGAVPAQAVSSDHEASARSNAAQSIP